MSYLIRNRSFLAVLKKNLEIQSVRNCSILSSTNDITKKKQKLWINKTTNRHNTTLENPEPKEAIPNLATSAVDNHYDVIIIGGGMVSINNLNGDPEIQ